MVSRPELGSDPPFGSGRESGRDIRCPYSFKNYEGQTLECNLKVEIPIRL